MASDASTGHTFGMQTGHMAAFKSASWHKAVHRTQQSAPEWSSPRLYSHHPCAPACASRMPLLPPCCCCCCPHREEQRSFEAWRDSLETVPTIKALRAKAEAIRAAEFEKALKGLGDGMSKKQMKAVEELSKGIVNKLLHGPMTALRCDGTDPDAVGQTLANMDALERMFQLSQQQQQVPARK